MWWEFEHQVSNMGIRTGPESGLVVLDVDPRHGGDESLRQLEDQHGPLPETPTVRTGGGGQHFYFQHPGFRVPSRSGVLGAGLDIRGDGGSVVAPPSLHVSGKPYQWESERTPSAVSVAPLPASVLALLREPSRLSSGGSAGSHGSWGIGADGLIPEGQRNETLFRIACQLYRAGLSDAMVLEDLLEWNMEKCASTLSEHEVQQIVRSAARYVPATGTTGEPCTDRSNARHVVAQHKQNLTEKEDSTSTEQVTQRIAASLADMHTLQEELTSSPHSHDELELALATTTSLGVSEQDNTALVWLLIVGVPSSDKTATVLLLRDSPQTFYLDTLTENSFVSGFTESQPGKKAHQDLLPLLDGKCLIVKDLTTLFSLREDRIKKILGDLQSIYDGEYAKATGTVGVKRYQSRFACVGCITPLALAKHHNYMSSIGSRFLYYHIPPLTAEERGGGFERSWTLAQHGRNGWQHCAAWPLNTWRKSRSCPMSGHRKPQNNGSSWSAWRSSSHTGAPLWPGKSRLSMIGRLAQCRPKSLLGRCNNSVTSPVH